MKSPSLVIYLLAGAAVGGLALLSTRIAFVPILIMGVAVLSIHPRLGIEKSFLWALTLLLLGYAFLGKGFAYLGSPPIFVGEFVLLLAILRILFSLTATKVDLFDSLLLAFIGLGAWHTALHFPVYGIDSLRDGVIWGYAIFAVALGRTLTVIHIQRLIAWLPRVIPIYLLWVPLARFTYVNAAPLIPVLPVSNIPILVFKAGDMAVHMTAAAAFILLGFVGRRRSGATGPYEWALWILWFFGAFVLSTSRGGMLAILLGLGSVVVLHSKTRWATMAGIGLFLVCLFGLMDFQLEKANREISVKGILGRLTSAVSDSGKEKLEGTKEWRIDWWGKIVTYTFDGPYFFTGKGFGVNLADDDGFQTFGAADPEAPLRSPHNIHLTILARMGVPGFLLWILLQASYGTSLVSAAFKARRAGRSFWLGINLLTFSFWLASLVNATFDVYLEGPQGGIWFWSAFGLGLAALRIQRKDRNRLASLSPSAPGRSA